VKAIPIDINWHSGLPIFASEPFLKAVSDKYGWLGGIDDSGKIRCVLPYTIVKKAIFRMARFRVETVALGGDLQLAEEKAFLNSVVDQLRSLGADMIIPATTNSIFRTYPDGAIAAPYGTYIIDLTQSEADLWKNLSSSHRRKVRLATNDGVEIHEGMEYLRSAYHLVRETFLRSKVPFTGYEEFKRYVLSLSAQVKIYVATRKGAIQACLVVPFSMHTAYYVYGGSIPDPVAGATNLLHWEAIREFRGAGVNRYDFVGVRIQPEKGSKQEGLMTYKERFGGRLVRGYTWKYPFSAIKFGVYSMAVRLQRGGDVVDQEHSKLRNV
jgi:hypothetical protein